jgi:hypothetical protein
MPTATKAGKGFIVSINTNTIDKLKTLLNQKIIGLKEPSNLNYKHIQTLSTGSKTNDHFLYPIFIPSKGRHGCGQKKFLCHVPIFSVMKELNVPKDAKRIQPTEYNCLESDAHTMIFLLVEETEFQDYNKSFKEGMSFLFC